MIRNRSGFTPPPKRDGRRSMVAGFTLLEILIVLAVIVLLAFFGTNLITNTFKSKSREVSWRMASTVRYLYNTAITQNETIRLAFDFESNSYWAEATTEKFLLEKNISKEDAAKKAEEEKAKEHAEEQPEDQDTTTETPEGETFAEPVAPDLEPTEATFGSIETSLLETRQLPAGILLKDIQTSHDLEPVETGRAYIYFFRNGTAEEAIINLKDEADEKHISIKINPFNGETEISPEYKKLEVNK